jgi:hypothetical protein
LVDHRNGAPMVLLLRLPAYKMPVICCSQSAAHVTCTPPLQYTLLVCYNERHYITTVCVRA